MNDEKIGILFFLIIILIEIFHIVILFNVGNKIFEINQKFLLEQEEKELYKNKCNQLENIIKKYIGG